jgi:energy-coupling factor transporter ATP-binding protein EcfA2
MNEKTAEKENINPLVLLFPLFFYYKEVAPKLATRAESWTSVRISKFRQPAWTFLSLFLTLTTIVVGVLSLSNRNWNLALIGFIAWNITQIPLAKLYLFYRMNVLIKENEKGKIDPNLSYALKRARFNHGCIYSERRYSSIWKNAPGTAIGVRVEPWDQQLPIFGEPLILDSELPNVLDKKFAVIPLNESSPDHHLVIGQTGSGKTTLITRMVKAALNSNWKVIVLDLKGDPTDIPKFVNLVEDQSKLRLFPNHAFDFWQGSPAEIAERVISFFPNDTEPFYLNRNANAIHSVITRSGLPSPSSVEDLLERIRNGVRLAKSSSDINFFSQKDKGQDLGSILANDISIYLDPIRNIEKNSPFRFHWQDDWNLGLFTLDGFEPSSLKVANSLLHDFASWIFSDTRASNKKPILLIIDEASAFHALPRAPILSALIQRARSAQVSLVFASQSLSAFKDEKENLLHSGAIRWLGSSTEVEEMVEAAGTRSVIESGFQFEEIKYTGIVTHRNQKEFKIDPDFVKELRTFHWFVSSRGKVSSVFVPPLDWDSSK